jgi:hypothetical protein
MNNVQKHNICLKVCVPVRKRTPFADTIASRYANYMISSIVLEDYFPFYPSVSDFILENLPLSGVHTSRNIYLSFARGRCPVRCILFELTALLLLRGYAESFTFFFFFVQTEFSFVFPKIVQCNINTVHMT